MRPPSPLSFSPLFREKMAVRFLVTFAVNLSRAGAGFCASLIVARALGASDFGSYSFLLASFVATSQLIEAGTSSAFYTFIARRRRGRTFFLLYGAWLLAQFTASFVTLLLLPVGLLDFFWVGHERTMVMLALCASFVTTQGWPAVVQLAESRRRTVEVQITSLAQALIHVAALLVLQYMGLLTALSAIALLLIEYVLITGVVARMVLPESVDRAASESPREVVAEFGGYCRPLLVYGMVSFLYTFADRWLLQRYGGAAEQGYYAVGQQFAAVSLLATTSVLRVFWKEIAESHHHGNSESMERLYRRVSRSLYFAAGWCSALLIPFSREILGWTLGPAFESATVCLMLMLFYTVHQSLGQIQGTFLYASGETAAYARIGIIGMIASLVVAYVLLADPNGWLPGLGLGAVGLAIKMVVMQVVVINIQGIVIARRCRWRPDMAHQAIAFGLLVALSALAREIGIAVSGLASGRPHPAAVLSITVSIYTAATLLAIWRAPQLIGATRMERDRVGESVRHTLRTAFVAAAK